MQTAIDAFADTLFTDSPCSIEVSTCTQGDFTLSLDNITFEDRVSIQIRYLGDDTLSITAINGTVLDSNKISTPYGGTVTVTTPATLTVSGFASGSEVTVIKGGTTTILDQDTNATSPYTLSVQDSSVDVIVIHDNYNIVRIDGVVTTADATVPIVQDQDRVYNNP